MTLTHITLEHFRDDWDGCYEPERLAELFLRPLTPYEVLTRTDGPWADVLPEDRLRVVLRPEVIPDRTLHLLACDFAEAALLREREEGREPDPRSWTAIETKRRWVAGKATDAELTFAQRAAWAVAPETTAAAAAAWATAMEAMRAGDAARAARAARWAARWAASDAGEAGRAARAAVRAEQIRRVIEVMGWEGGAA